MSEENEPTDAQKIEILKTLAGNGMVWEVNFKLLEKGHDGSPWVSVLLKHPVADHDPIELCRVLPRVIGSPGSPQMKKWIELIGEAVKTAVEAINVERDDTEPLDPRGFERN